MIDIKSVREEMASIHAEATQFVETYSASEPSAEDQAKQDERFAKLEKLDKSIKAAETLARYAFTREQPVKAVAVTAAAQKSADQIATEAFASVELKLDRSEYGRQVTAYIAGREPENYASITTGSASGAVLPNIVKAGINLIAYNPYRKALATLGKSSVSFGTTAKISSSVISPFAGAALPEDGSSETNGNANAKLGMIATTPSGFQSTVFWYSNLELAAVDFDWTTQNLPAQAGATDTAFALAITAAIKADSNVTTSVTTASTSTITLDNLDDLNNALDPVFDNSKAIHLAKSAYIAAEKLKDSTGMPILSRDVQDQSLLRYKGTPVVKDTTLDAMGTATHLVGLCIGYDAFVVRDEDEKVLRYVNDADRPDKTGVNHVAYRAFGYLPAAVAKLVN